jgi:hypothetical protein
MVGVGTVVGQQLNHRVDPGLFWNNQNRVIPVIGGTALVISLTDTIKKLTGLTPMQIGDMSSSFGIASGISAAAVLAVEKIRRSNAVAISLAIGGTGCAMLALPLSITTVAAISGVAAGTLALLIG